MGTWKKIELTGKTRHRANIFGHLILQVEETAVYCGDIVNGYGDKELRHGSTGKRWRDAKTQDLEMLKENQNND